MSPGKRNVELLQLRGQGGGVAEPADVYTEVVGVMNGDTFTRVAKAAATGGRRLDAFTRRDKLPEASTNPWLRRSRAFVTHTHTCTPGLLLVTSMRLCEGLPRPLSSVVW